MNGEDSERDVAEMKKDVMALKVRKSELDSIAYKSTLRFFRAGFAAMVFQWTFFLRLTFVEFSWDDIEPITYFVRQILGIALYSYFLLTYNRPRTNEIFRSMVDKKRKALYRKAKFDLELYEWKRNKAYLCEELLRDSNTHR